MNINSETIESIVKRYVLGQLDDNEMEEFETYYLARPDIIQMVEDAQRINMGLVHNEAVERSAAQVADGLARKVTDGGSNTLLGRTLSRWLAPLSGPGMSMAMLLCLAVMAPFAWQGVSKGPGAGDPFMNAQLVRLDAPTVRSDGSANGYNLDANGKHAAVIVRVKEVVYPDYQLSVRSLDSHSELWRSERFSFPSGARDFLVLIPPVAAINNVDVKLLGIGKDDQQFEVSFCNYTEACF